MTKTNFHDTYQKTYDELAQMNFVTKEEYLVWVRNWKDFYKQLSEQIRSAKRYIKDSQNPKKKARPNPLSKMSIWQVYSLRYYSRSIAFYALALRADAKKESWEMKMRAQELSAVS